MKKILTFTILIFLSCQKQEKTVTEYVNPFIGTGGHGHTYPGVSAPFGMVQLSPDTRLEGWDGCGGYHYSDDYIYGFSPFYAVLLPILICAAVGSILLYRTR